MNAIRAGVPLYMYLVNRKEWVGKPILLQFNGRDDELMSVTTTTVSARDASIMTIAPLSKQPGELLNVSDLFKIKCMSSDDIRHILTPSNSRYETNGASLVYTTDGGPTGSIWKVSNRSKTVKSDRQQLYYGVPYTIIDMASAKVLKTSEITPRLIIEHEQPHISTWVFIPTFLTYTCQNETRECINGSGSANPLSNMRCDPYVADKCVDRFGNKIFFDARSCSSMCSRVGDDLISATAAGDDGDNVALTITPHNAFHPVAFTVVLLLGAIVTFVVRKHLDPRRA